MNYRDTWEVCSKCESKFVFTVEDKRAIDYDELDTEYKAFCANCKSGETEKPVEHTMKLDPVTGHWVGTIKWFDLNKGYGFIDRGDGSDIFVHRSELEGDPTSYLEDLEVTYEVEESIKGPQATQVRPFYSSDTSSESE